MDKGQLYCLIVSLQKCSYSMWCLMKCDKQHLFTKFVDTLRNCINMFLIRKYKCISYFEKNSLEKHQLGIVGLYVL